MAATPEPTFSIPIRSNTLPKKQHATHLSRPKQTESLRNSSLYQPGARGILPVIASQPRLLTVERSVASESYESERSERSLTRLSTATRC